MAVNTSYIYQLLTEMGRQKDTKYSRELSHALQGLDIQARQDIAADELDERERQFNIRYVKTEDGTTPIEVRKVEVMEEQVDVAEQANVIKKLGVEVEAKKAGILGDQVIEDQRKNLITTVAGEEKYYGEQYELRQDIAMDTYFGSMIDKIYGNPTLTPEGGIDITQYMDAAKEKELINTLSGTKTEYGEEMGFTLPQAEYMAKQIISYYRSGKNNTEAVENLFEYIGSDTWNSRVTMSQFPDRPDEKENAFFIKGNNDRGAHFSNVAYVPYDAQYIDLKTGVMTPEGQLRHRRAEKFILGAQNMGWVPKPGEGQNLLKYREMAQVLNEYSNWKFAVEAISSERTQAYGSNPDFDLDFDYTKFRQEGGERPLERVSKPGENSIQDIVATLKALEKQGFGVGPPSYNMALGDLFTFGEEPSPYGIGDYNIDTDKWETSFKGVDYTPNPNASDSENYLGLLDDNEHLEKVFDTYNENLKWVNQNITDSLLLPGYVGSDNQVVDVLGQFQLDQATKVINDLISSN